MLLFGGGSVAHCNDELWVLDTHTMEWSRPEAEGPVPPPRAGACAGKGCWVCAGACAWPCAPAVVLQPACSCLHVCPACACRPRGRHPGPHLVCGGRRQQHQWLRRHVCSGLVATAGGRRPAGALPGLRRRAAQQRSRRSRMQQCAGAACAAICSVALLPARPELDHWHPSIHSPPTHPATHPPHLCPQWTLVGNTPVESAIASEGLSLLPVPMAGCMVSFGGYNGRYHNAGACLWGRVGSGAPMGPGRAPAAAPGTGVAHCMLAAALAPPCSACVPA